MVHTFESLDPEFASKVQPGDFVVLSAFGGGLSSAASVVRW